MPGTKLGAKRRLGSFQVYEDTLQVESQSSKCVELDSAHSIKRLTRLVIKWQLERRALDERVSAIDVQEGRGSIHAIASFDARCANLSKRLRTARSLVTKARTQLDRYLNRAADKENRPVSIESNPSYEKELRNAVKARTDAVYALDDELAKVHRGDESTPSAAAVPAPLPREHRLEEEIIRRSIKSIFGFEPRPVQIEIIKWLIFDRRDCIVTGKTSMGKSLPIQSLPLLIEGTVAIIILPLDKIGAEQVEKCSKLGDGKLARPIHLNGDTKHKQPDVFDRMRRLEYTHIFLGPEQAISSEFAAVLTYVPFKRALCLVAIDEAHVVKKWGRDFRPSFAQLSLLRTRLGRTNAVPWYACTATLDDDGAEALVNGAGFCSSTHRIRASIDRPDVALAFQPIPSSQQQPFACLAFTLRDCSIDGALNANGIPRTIIFVESKRKTRLIAKQLRSWMKCMCPNTPDASINRVVRTYHRNTAERDKDQTYELARDNHSTLRIIVATESLGLGVDLPYIERVILYGLPIERDLDTIVQRIGRCVRVPIRPDGSPALGLGVVLYEARFEKYKNLSNLQSIATQASDRHERETSIDSQMTEILEDVEADHDNVPAVDDSTLTVGAIPLAAQQGSNKIPAILLDILRSLSDGRCVRKIILAHYQEDLSNPATRSPPAPSERCCSSCNADILSRCRFELPAVVRPRNQPRGAVQCTVRDRLQQYCKDRAQALVPNVSFCVPAEVFLHANLISRLAHASLGIRSVQDVWGALDQAERQPTEGEASVILTLIQVAIDEGRAIEAAARDKRNALARARRKAASNAKTASQSITSSTSATQVSSVATPASMAMAGAAIELSIFVPDTQPSSMIGDSAPDESRLQSLAILAYASQLDGDNHTQATCSDR